MTEKISIVHSPEGESRMVAAYDASLSMWPVPYQEIDVKTRFGDTHMIVSGPTNGQPLFLLHGQEASATMWRYNIEALSQVFRVYAVDTIGDIGKSRPVRLPQNRADYAAWLLDVVNELQLERVSLVGISYGGFLAVNFAIAYPERVGRIGLLSPGIPNFGPPTLQWANYGLPMLMFPSRFTIQRFIQGASQKGYSAQDPVHEQMVISVPYLRERNFPRPVFDDDELRHIHTLCLLMIGDHEIMYDPVKALERARQLIPNLKTEIIADAGHFLNSDQAEIINDLLLRFLNISVNLHTEATGGFDKSE
jgi:pimeloyl-ACP methyl ester carboxylesterase